MADFSELTIGGAQKSVGQAGEGIAESYGQGAELALKAEQIQQTKQKLIQDAQQLQATKLDKFNEALDKAQRWTDPKARSNYLKNVLPRMRDSYGLADTISDGMLNSLITNDEARGKYYTLNLYQQQGLLSAQEALAIANDEVKFADIPSTPVEMRGKDDYSADEALKTLQDNQAKQQQMAQSANQFQQGQKATETRDRLDRKEKLDKKITDLGITDAIGDINTLNTGIPGGIKGYKGGEIPGISGPSSKMPGSELTGAAAQNRQALQRLVNIKLKQMSGSAVMDQELARTLDALGVSTTYNNNTWAPVANILTGLKKPATPDKVMQGIRYLERSISNEQRKLKNTYGKDLYDEVTAGTETGSLATAPAAASGTPPPAPDQRVATAVGIVKGMDKATATAGLTRKGFTPEQIAQVLKQAGIK